LDTIDTVANENQQIAWM